MLTRCPACETHFRVTAEQLKARSGRVRCGACQYVFNALDSLIEEPMIMVGPAAHGSAQQTPPPPLPEPGAKAIAQAEIEVDELSLVPASEPAADTPEELAALGPEEQEPSILESTPAAEPETAVTAAAEPDTAAEATTDAMDWSETFPAPPPPPRRWPWVIGSLMALSALGLQAALAFRVELAVLWPQARPALVALCEIAGCEVGLPAKVGLVGIEASDLHPDNDHPGRLTLTATLKSRAPFAQQFPHLELTLTDTADKAIARRVLTPTDYLPATTLFANGMQPNTDVMVTVGVEAGGMTASGYRLYLFYP